MKRSLILLLSLICVINTSAQIPHVLRLPNAETGGVEIGKTTTEELHEYLKANYAMGDSRHGTTVPKGAFYLIGFGYDSMYFTHANGIVSKATFVRKSDAGSAKVFRDEEIDRFRKHIGSSAKETSLEFGGLQFDNGSLRLTISANRGKSYAITLEAI